jgi:hypothetical protein
MNRPLDDVLDLSARARRGEASEAELTRLRSALRSSATLQVSHRLGADFDAALAVRASDAELLDAVIFKTLAKTPGAARQTTWLKRRRRSVVWLAAAASLLVSAGAFGLWRIGNPRSPRAAVLHAEHGSPSASGAPTPRYSPARAPDRRAAGAQAPVSNASAVAAGMRASGTAAPGVATAVGAPSALQTPAHELFAQANRARNARRAEEAIALYRLLQAAHPSSPEAATSGIALGRLLLGQGDHAGALKALDAQANGAGALAEEALLWRARTLQNARSPDETQAWRTLLQRFPRTVYEQEARSRLAGRAPATDH